MNCINCGNNPVKIKKWNLCRHCYHVLYNNGLLSNIIPIKKDKKEYIVNKFGSEIIEDCNKAIKNPDVTLTSIAMKYEITREYARRIFSVLMGFPFTVIKKRKSINIKENKNIQKHNIEQKIKRLNVESSKVRDGLEAEKLVWDICSKMGYVVTESLNNKCDIIINGFVVEVKSKKCPNKIVNSSKQYFFNVRKDQISILDFLILCVIEENIFYIIPKSAIGNIKGFYISNNINKNRSKWIKFKNAWHLLERNSVVEINRIAYKEELL